jgi:hypothetical protein
LLSGSIAPLLATTGTGSKSGTADHTATTLIPWRKTRRFIKNASDNLCSTFASLHKKTNADGLNKF